MKLSKKVKEQLPHHYPMIWVVVLFVQQNRENVDIETAVLFAAELVGFELQSFATKQLQKLNNAIVSKKIVEQQGYTEVLYETDRLGILSIEARHIQLEYEGVTFNSSSYARLIINGREFEVMTYNKEVLDKKIEEIKTLVGEEKEKIGVYDKVMALSTIFESYKNGDGRASYAHLVDLVYELWIKPNDAITQAEVQEKYHWVIQQYLDYLWNCAEKNKSMEYVCGFIGFMKRNRDLWAQGCVDGVERLNLYLDEHDNIRRSFLNEPPCHYGRYFVPLGKTDIVCEREVNYRQRLAVGTIDSPLNGWSKTTDRS